MKKLSEIAEDYKIALTTLNNGIKELSCMRDAAIMECWKNRIDPKHDGTVCSIVNRLKPLIEMQKDLREVTKEVEHYYDRGWWRSEAYTCNKRKSRSFIYAGSSR
jgi:hypothetical protein